jgi:hypothetical protein
MTIFPKNRSSSSNAQARDLEQTIARNVAEILEG